MINFVSGNIFDSTAEALVNAVNCQGISGAGIALAFKERFPNEQGVYEAHCALGRMYPGDVLYVRAVEHADIMYAATKLKFWHKSNLMDVNDCIVNIAHHVVDLNLHHVACPMLGCGLGGLDPYDVTQLFYGNANRFEGRVLDVYKREGAR